MKLTRRRWCGYDIQHLTNMPGSPPQAVVPGDTWNLQCWYRGIGNTNNFTDAVSVTFN